MRNLVEMHGGSVQARSDGLGKGSEFIVSLPLSAAPTATKRAGGEKSLEPTKYRILVADDNADSLECLSLLHKAMGHDIQTARDGLEAVKAARAFRPEVLLLDIGMPRMNGYEAARQVRE